MNIKYVFVTTAGAKKAMAFLAVSDMEKALPGTLVVAHGLAAPSSTATKPHNPPPTS